MADRGLEKLEIEREKLKLERERLKGEGKEREAKKSGVEKGYDFVRNIGFVNLMIFVGIIFHIIHGVVTRLSFYRFPKLIYLYVIVAILFIILFGLGDRRKFAIVFSAIAAAVLFEWFYYDVSNYIINYFFADKSIPYFVSKAFWNGWIIVGAFVGFNSSKLAKVCSYAIVLFLALNLFIYLPVEKYITEKAEIKTEEAGKGVLDTLRTYGDEFKCSMVDPAEKTKCMKEAEWSRATSAQITAMRKTCAVDVTAVCDCYYAKGKEREDCLERKSKATAKELEGAAKDLTPMNVEFEAPRTSESLTKAVRLDPIFKILSPYKAVDVEIDCKVYGKDGKIDSLIDNKPGVLQLPSIKTDEKFEYLRRFSCKSVGDVPVGDYTFNLTASLNRINTNASFVGLYTHPNTLEAYKLFKSAGFEELLEAEMKTAYPRGKVESRSDPDLTWLKFSIEPLVPSGVEGVSALSKEGDSAKFKLMVSLDNKETGSIIKSVESLEFTIPGVFTPTCSDVYQISHEGGFTKISAKKDILNVINFRRIKSGAKSTPISDLNCEYLVANIDLEKPDVVTSIEFKGSITYSQDVTQKFTVKRVG